MSIDEIRQGSRMKRMKNGTNVEGTDSEVCGTWKARRNGPRKKRVRERGSSRQTEDGV